MDDDDGEHDGDGSTGDADGEGNASDAADVHVGTQKRGTKAMQRYWFMAGPKDSDKKHIRLRGKRVVPVPIGPALPRRDQPDVRTTWYCRLMLIPFKP